MRMSLSPLVLLCLGIDTSAAFTAPTSVGARTDR